VALVVVYCAKIHRSGQADPIRQASANPRRVASGSCAPHLRSECQSLRPLNVVYLPAFAANTSIASWRSFFHHGARATVPKRALFRTSACAKSNTFDEVMRPRSNPRRGGGIVYLRTGGRLCGFAPARGCTLKSERGGKRGISENHFVES